MKPRVQPLILPFAYFLCTGFSVADPVDLEGLTWAEQKCALYQSAWDWSYDHFAGDGISAEFIEQNNEFVARGCREKVHVCPRSAQEIEMANMLTVMTMSEGMASTFVPFSCGPEDE